MPYRNVYEEKNKRLSGVRETSEPEKDPKKIERIYQSQMPSAAEVAQRAGMLTAPNLTARNGEQVNAAEKRYFNRGIGKGVLGKSQNRDR